MKLKNKIFSLMLLATIAVGCTDDFESTNSDPNKLYNIELRNIFPAIWLCSCIRMQTLHSALPPCAI